MRAAKGDQAGAVAPDDLLEGELRALAGEPGEAAVGLGAEQGASEARVAQRGRGRGGDHDAFIQPLVPESFMRDEVFSLPTRRISEDHARWIAGGPS
jgi:hypothetical protein